MEDTFHALAGRYTSAPDWVQRLLGGAYGALPKPLRFGSSYTRFLDVFQRPETVAAYRVAALARTLDLALRHVPAYARSAKYVDGLGDDPRAVLRELPLTSKAEIKAATEPYLAAMATSDSDSDRLEESIAP